jgi:arylformamidase
VDASFELYDVTMWMEDFVFPGDPPLSVTGPQNVLSGDNPEYIYEFAVSTQTGTHVQGPHYFIRDGARVNELPLRRFQGQAHLVDLVRRGVDTTAEDLMGLLGEGDLTGNVIVLRTGHMDELVAGQPLTPETRPGLSMDAARWLVEDRGIGMIAIDSVGVESRQSLNYEVNVYLCQQSIVILEGLVNLDRVHGHDLWLEAYPLKMRGVEGTPCRAVIKSFKS